MTTKQFAVFGLLGFVFALLIWGRWRYDLVAFDIAKRLDVNPAPFLMAVVVVASCAFLTTIGHKNNTLIMGPGGDRFDACWRHMLSRDDEHWRAFNQSL